MSLLSSDVSVIQTEACGLTEEHPVYCTILCWDVIYWERSYEQVMNSEAVQVSLKAGKSRLGVGDEVGAPGSPVELDVTITPVPHLQYP